MIKSLLFSILIILSLSSFSQSDSLIQAFKNKKKYVIGFTPSFAGNIYGIALGPVGSEVMCGFPFYKKSHGINIQFIGQGIFRVFAKKSTYSSLHKNDPAKLLQDTLKAYDMLRAQHNGILISTFGANETNVNGIGCSLIYGNGAFINGLALNLILNQFNKMNGVSLGLLNQSGKTNGVQIGLINKTVKLKGIQIGLWNINESRSLPFINWGIK